MLESLFGETIYSYTRKQAIEDGNLVDVSQKWEGRLDSMSQLPLPENYTVLLRTFHQEAITKTTMVGYGMSCLWAIWQQGTI